MKIKLTVESKNIKESDRMFFEIVKRIASRVGSLEFLAIKMKNSLSSQHYETLKVHHCGSHIAIHHYSNFQGKDKGRIAIIEEV